MHHFSTETSKTIAFDQNNQQKSYKAILEAALSAPYLMYEILAVAALHLSILLPAQQGYYHHQASGLQTRALSLFNASRLEVDAENCISVVIFSSLLATHSLCDVVLFRNNDFSTFLDDFIGCLNLHRGVRSITSHSWHLLQETHLKPVLDAGEALGQTAGLMGKECDDLRALLNSDNIGQLSVKAYQSTIDHLQKAFDVERISGGHTDSFIIWPVLVSADYMDLLVKRSPEALVILAYYAILLHNHRDLWFIGDAGLYLADSITRHLGVYWDTWLAWPNAIIHGRPQQVLQTRGAE
jgi:Fungal specific transcription factor domain